MDLARCDNHHPFLFPPRDHGGAEVAQEMQQTPFEDCAILRGFPNCMPPKYVWRFGLLYAGFCIMQQNLRPGSRKQLQSIADAGCL